MAFFAAALSLYALFNAYILIRGRQALPKGAPRVVFAVTLVILALSLIGGRLLESRWPGRTSTVLVWAGSLWVGAGLYFLLVALAVDVVRVADGLLHFLPRFVTADPARAGLVTALSSGVVVAVLVAGGFLNARNPRVRRLDLTLPRKSSAMQSLHIVLVSDIHLGLVVGRGRIDRIAREITALGGDIVIFGGDVLDEDVRPVIRRNLGETLRTVTAPLGVYGVTGNHEYIGGIEETTSYLREHGIRMLMDEVVRVDDSFQLVGRKDASCKTFTGADRTPLETLMRETDASLPVILLDHQPRALRSSAAAGVDLELCGHTHCGQLWPLRYIVADFYEIVSGLARFGSMRVYVSAGAGTWGPPVRVGNRPEIVDIHIAFE